MASENRILAAACGSLSVALSVTAGWLMPASLKCSLVYGMGILAGVLILISIRLWNQKEATND